VLPVETDSGRRISVLIEAKARGTIPRLPIALDGVEFGSSEKTRATVEEITV
jgi:hypothetical protein